ncbi:MAG TPA: hypothetical protein VM487_01470 [Phycisphaerae bacterium]|nr:hypothetical protein [Phycisphaerae bacterium]
MSQAEQGEGGEPGGVGRCRRVGRRAAVVFVLAVGVRLVFMVGEGTYSISPKRNYWNAGWETGRIGWHLAEGRGFALELDQFGPRPAERTAWLAPLYPLVVGAVFRVCGSYTKTSFVVIYVLQIVLAGWTAVLLLRLGRELGRPSVGLLAGVMFALWAPAAAFCVRFIWGTTLLTALSVWLIVLLIRLERDGGRVRAVAVGAVTAALLLLEPAVVLFLPAAAVWLVARGGRRAVRQVVVIGVTVMVLVGPWMCRNYAAFGEVFFIKSNLGHELFIGNNPTADGFYRWTDAVAGEVLDEATYGRLVSADEFEMNRILGGAAAGYIGEDPGRFVRLSGRRVWWFWRLKFDAKWDELLGGRTAWKYLRGFDEAGQDVLLILAYLGAVFGLKRRAGVGLPLLFLLTYPIPYYVTHVDIPRYRFPVVPLVMLLSAYAIVEGVRFVRRRRSTV